MMDDAMIGPQMIPSPAQIPAPAQEVAYSGPEQRSEMEARQVVKNEVMKQEQRHLRPAPIRQRI